MDTRLDTLKFSLQQPDALMAQLKEETAWISTDWKRMPILELKAALEKTEALIISLGLQLREVGIDPVHSDHALAMAMRNAMDTCGEAWDSMDLFKRLKGLNLQPTAPMDDTFF